jgi:hypothetical protein
VKQATVGFPLVGGGADHPRPLGRLRCSLTHFVPNECRAYQAAAGYDAT